MGLPFTFRQLFYSSQNLRRLLTKLLSGFHIVLIIAMFLLLYLNRDLTFRGLRAKCLKLKIEICRYKESVSISFVTKFSQRQETVTAQKIKFSIKDFSSKCDQIRKLRNWSHLLKKSLIENFIFCEVCLGYSYYFRATPETNICSKIVTKTLDKCADYFQSHQ